MRPLASTTASALFVACAAPASAAVIFTDGATGVVLIDGDNSLTAQIHSGTEQTSNTVVRPTMTTPPVDVTFQGQSVLHVNGNGYAKVDDGSTSDNQIFDDLDIFLTTNPNGFSAIEFSVQYDGFTGQSPPAFLYLSLDLLGGGTVDFAPLTITGNMNADYQIHGDGDDVFSRLRLRSFATTAQLTGRAFKEIKQVDIQLAPAPIPEPAAWAMMLGGFGLLGAAIRRSRRTGAITA